MTIFRKLSVLFLSFIIIVTVTLWILSRAITPEMVREYVSEELSSITSQPSHVNGDITWEIFPHPGIKLTNIQVGDSFSHKNYILKLDNLFLNLKITPLLRGKLVFSDIKGDGFDIQINPEVKPTINKVTANKVNVPAAKPLDNRFAIERLLLSHGKITLIQDETKFILSNLQIGAEQINLQEASFPLQLKSTIVYIQNDKRLAKAQLQFKGRANLSAALFNNPTEGIKSTRFNGQLIIQNAELEHFKLNRLNANTSFKNKTLTLNPLTINLYQGESIGNLNYELDTKVLIVNQTASGMDSAKLSNDLFNKKLFQGKLDLSLHSKADLGKANWQDNVFAKGNFTIKDGKLEAINLNKVVSITGQKIDDLLSGKNKEIKPYLQLTSFDSPEFFQGNTPFKLLTLQYSVNKTILNSDALFLQTEILELKGNGQLNLNDYALNSHFKAAVNLTQKKVNEIQQLLGGSFPFTAKGTLINPVVTPDLSKINPILTHLLIKDTLKKPVETIKDQLLRFSISK